MTFQDGAIEMEPDCICKKDKRLFQRPKCLNIESTVDRKQLLF